MSGENTNTSRFDLDTLLPRLKRLLRHVWKHFGEDRLFEEAASLSYTSLLAMVPLLAVIVGVVSIFPVFSEWSVKFQNFIFSNFVPATGETIRAYVETFLSSVGKLTLPGTVFLIVTALLLMSRIEVAFNKVWRVTEKRSITNRIVMYWAVLTLCPIMIGAAAALGAQNVLAALNFDSAASPRLQRFGIFVLMWMAFTLIFVLVPNRKVRFRDAIFGAFLTALLFEIAKSGFLAYVKNANYAVIYGALATVPIFLFWLYLVWTVVLFGASLAASLTTFREQSEPDLEWPPKLIFQLAIRVVGHLWEAQREGTGRHVSDLLSLEPVASEAQLRQLLDKLQSADIVSRHDEKGWLLTRDLEEMTCGDLLAAGSFYLPLEELEQCPRDGKWDSTAVNALESIRDEAGAVLQTPLRQLYMAG